MLHRYYDPSHYMHHFTDTRYTGITATYTHRTSVHACVGSIFLSYGPPCILHVLLYHVTVFMLYDCFLLLIWIFLILDMRAVDMRYVESHIYCSCYIVPVILFSWYCSRFRVYCSRYIVLCYQQSSGPVIMLPVSCTVICSCYIGYLTYQIIMITGVWGRLDGWLDLIGWCTGSILFSHCRGR